MNQLKPITEHVCDMLRERSERGLAKYGTTIDRDDLSPAQWLQHLQEELLDAAQYVEALKRQSAPPAALAVQWDVREAVELLKSGAPVVEVWEKTGIYSDGLCAIRDAIAPPAAAVPGGWREHVEDRIRTWRQSFVNHHGDQLEMLDFMGPDSLDDLIDFVCSGQVQPAAAVPEGYALVPVQSLRWWRELAEINPQDLVPRIDAVLAAANKENNRE